MAKKQKRRVSASSPSDAPLSLADERPAAVNATRASYTQEFNPDYTHVTHDLKQIAIMAGSFLVVLVALSFILR
jgi:hypothetical protein